MRTRSTRWGLVLLSWCLGLSLLWSCFGIKANHSSNAQWDVRGNYDINYDNKIKLQLNIGGAIREATATGYGDVLDFGVFQGKPLKLNLQEFCDKPEVKCPNEIFWNKVSIDQKSFRVKQNVHIVYVINNTKRDLPIGQKAETLGGFVDHTRDTRFIVGIGIKGGANQACAALSFSYADGRFTHKGENVGTKTVYRDQYGKSCQPGSNEPTSSDAAPPESSTPDTNNEADAGADGGAPDGGASLDGGSAPDAATPEREPIRCTPREVPAISKPDNAAVEGIADGRIVIGWLGGCAFGPFLVGATLTLQTGFSGSRTGTLDPPPYQPVAPIEPDSIDASSPESP